MHTIRFDGKTPGIAECDRETALLAASAKAKVPLNHRCGGHARCVLLALKANPDQRLACQTWARGDVSVKY